MLECPASPCAHASRDPDGVVVGVDAGGTSTRALVMGLDGTPLGWGRAGGGNPNAHPPAEAAEQVTIAVRAALGDRDPATVRGGVLGMAGASKLTDPAVATLYEAAWRRTGLRCPPRIVADYEAAFAAGTTEPDGTVLVAGTGSVAARIACGRQVATAGGYGWLLGDEGSAFWLGREAVRVALRAVESSAPPEWGRLTTAVLDELLPELPEETSAEDRRQVLFRLITAVNADRPIRLARLAPLVTTAAVAGDGAAADVVRRAGRLLAELALSLRVPGDRTPIVLVGGLLGADGPVGAAVRAELAERCDAPVYAADDGAVGAARLALLGL